MTTIRTTCNRCGDVELTSDDLSLELAADSGSGTYRFECPFCGIPQRRPASERVVSILMATGVAYRIVPTDGPITEDEIHSFVSALDEEGWLSEIR
ncbi:MAG: hypothetical protein KJP12_06650 [Acidimicrobiia bacterium]|nr:hypothetical protein [Acidimicrobiia bacterium]MBT8214889.1 hypothetical protein [Acidimicrobiia bacterium]NNF68649.1 hypothetical protein [Acidimicrobiia bacterium]NNK92651.1 hypothetical protein [Acidimicrobiia bacterium]